MVLQHSIAVPIISPSHSHFRGSECNPRFCHSSKCSFFLNNFSTLDRLHRCFFLHIPLNAVMPMSKPSQKKDETEILYSKTDSFLVCTRSDNFHLIRHFFGSATFIINVGANTIDNSSTNKWINLKAIAKGNTRDNKIDNARVV